MTLLELIDGIPDPRMSGKVQHNLCSIIFVTLCGILSGCESWSDIEDYCDIKFDWLRQYVDFSNGVPSSWTFRRVFTLLDPDTLELLLRTHASFLVSGGKATDHIVVDGKSLCGSARSGLQSLQSVSAWCHENGLVLAEKQVSSKSNEITALPFLLESLDLKGHTVSIDAAGCQKSISHLIQGKKGEYVFGLKRNHPKLYGAIEHLIDEKGEEGGIRLHDSFDDSHGRLIRRRYFGYGISGLSEVNDWAGARTVVAVETIRLSNNNPKREVTSQWRYYLSSHKHDNPKLP